MDENIRIRFVGGNIAPGECAKSLDGQDLDSFSARFAAIVGVIRHANACIDSLVFPDRPKFYTNLEWLIKFAGDVPPELAPWLDPLLAAACELRLTELQNAYRDFRRYN